MKMLPPSTRPILYLLTSLEQGKDMYLSNVGFETDTINPNRRDLVRPRPTSEDRTELAAVEATGTEGAIFRV